MYRKHSQFLEILKIMYILHTFKTADIGCCTDRVECFALNNYKKFCSLFFFLKICGILCSNMKYYALAISGAKSKERKQY